MRFYIAFNEGGTDGGSLVESPTWTRLDDSYAVQACQIRRGRQYELDRTETGTASVTFVDTAGDFDPTWAAGAYWNLTYPGKQARIDLVNPTDSSATTIFRGFVSGWRFQPHPTERMLFVTVDMVDALAVLAAAEYTTDVAYAEDATTDAAQTRIVSILDTFQWPPAPTTTGQTSGALRNIFSGNVKLQAVKYAPRTSVLAMIQDCADAEFPHVSNVFASKDGKITFKGRYPKLRPDVVEYDVDRWQLGDVTAADADPTNVVPVSPPLTFRRDDAQWFNYAYALPANIATADIDTDATAATSTSSIDEYGYRTWSAENLLTLGGANSTTANQECQLMSQYFVDNYDLPKVNVDQITVRPQPPGGSYGDATWALMCGVELGDIVELTTYHPWGGGFSAAEFFVEGIGYAIVPMSSDHDDVTLTLDVSNAEYYAQDGFYQ